VRRVSPQIGDRADQPSGERGFSLIEVLVVVAILGLISVIMTVAVSKTLKRQRLETAAHEIQSFVERAYVNSASFGQAVFVQVSDPAADGSRTMNMFVDAAPGDGVYDSATDTRIGTQPITSDIQLVTGSTTWPKPTGQTYYLLECNTLGQAMTAPLKATPQVDYPVRLDAPVALALTHKEMASGNLTPNMRFDVMVNVLWRPNIVRYRNGTKVP